MKHLQSEPGVYGIVNNLSSSTNEDWPWKTYIGSSVNVYKRCLSHLCELSKNEHPNKHLQASFNKYGEAAFSFMLMQDCDALKCIEFEQWWLDRLVTFDRNYGYNCSPTAGNCLGVKHSEEVCAARSVILKASYANEEVRKARSEMVNELWQQEEYIEKHKAGMEYAWSDPALRKKRSELAKKKWEDPEYKKVMSDAQKRRFVDNQEAHDKVSERLRERWADPKEREKMSVAQKKACADPVVRQRKSDCQKKRLADPNERKKLSETAKRVFNDPVKKAAWLAKRRATIAKKKAEKQLQSGDEKTLFD